MLTNCCCILLIFVLILIHPFFIGPGFVQGRGDATAKGAVPMKKYVVDLDKPPEERWIPILSDYKTSVPLIIEYFNNQVMQNILCSPDRSKQRN